MKYIFAFIIFLSGAYVYSQKAIKKVVLAKEVSFIEVDANNVFNVSMQTHKGDDVIIVTKMEGEYQNEFVNTVKEEGTTLFIGVEQRPLFNKPNDKLGAHKVISVSLEIEVPEYKEVYISGNYTGMELRGHYKSIEAITANELIVLDNISGGTIKARTRNGNIVAQKISGEVRAKSEYGKVYKGSLKPGNTNFELNSLNGNIYINKTE
ncbi:hypothetical protein [Galbibacter pacificus]|uniref:Adhesin domain-containing protein n=1 Tax=Galbibacter pacificus TaxID=2996052 RepID=A0ABT6FTL7_9FLAO|nr:hypothetical protein [Galbibacter pacificus]MDG3583142.1 hypothetical protein [Galbibacter pacificus]MDG3586623.1 hypothetical protein [Galbibacter pacificus]